MAYKAPGFKVKQQYVRQEKLAANPPVFPTGVIGASNIIVEGPDAVVKDYNGKRITYRTNGTQPLRIDYPKRDPIYDEVDLSSVRIYLIPANTSMNIGIRHFSRDYIRGFAGTKLDAIDVPYVDITQVVRDLSWTDPVSGDTISSGIRENEILIPALLLDGNGNSPVPHNLSGSTTSIVINTDGTSENNFAIVVEYQATKSHTIKKAQEFSLLMGNMDVGQTTFQTNDYPILFSSANPTQYLKVYATYVDDSDSQNPVDVQEDFVYYDNFVNDKDFSESGVISPEYWVDPYKGIIFIEPTYNMVGKTLHIEYNTNNPIYSSLQYVETVDDIESKFGVIHPLNPIAFGTYLAVKGSERGVYAVATTCSNSTYYGAFDLDDVVDIEEKLDMLAERGVYSYVVLSNFAILPILDSFVKKREEKLDYVKTAIGFCGFEDLSETGFSSDNKTVIVNDALRKVSGINEKRIDVLFNPVLKTNFYSFEYPVPGVYGAASLMALTGKLMNDSTPMYQLTYQSLPLISGIYYPLNNRLYFSQDQITTLSANGYIVLEQGISGYPTIVDQVTSDTLDEKGREHSVVASVDWSSKDINNLVQEKIKNTQTLTTSKLTLIVDMINERLKQHAAMGLISDNVQVDSFGIDPENPKFVYLEINYFPELPMKGGTVILRIQTL